MSDICSLSILKCVACGKVTPPDLACILDFSNGNLLTGECFCIFHENCLVSLRNQNSETILRCSKCQTSTKKYKKVTNRSCLLCHSYTATIFCNFCTLSTLNTLKEKTISQSVAVIEHVINDILFAAKINPNLFKYYNAWFLLYLNKYGNSFQFYFDLKTRQSIFINDFYLLKRLWLYILQTEKKIDVEKWNCCVLPQLQNIKPFTKSLTTELLLSISMFDAKLSISSDHLIVNLKIQQTLHCPQTTTNYIFGSMLIKENKLSQYEKLVAKNLWCKIYIASQNDFLYFERKFVPTVPRIPNFLRLYESHLKNES